MHKRQIKIIYRNIIFITKFNTISFSDLSDITLVLVLESSFIKKLSKKLSCSAGILNLIKDNIPEELHKNLYYTLFESHLSYGITVWGGVSNNKIEATF